MAVTRMSVWSALACKNPLFWRFLQVADEAAAIAAVRTKCGVQSRAEFDSDEAARARHDEIIRFPFTDFYNRQEQHP